MWSVLIFIFNFWCFLAPQEPIPRKILPFVRFLKNFSSLWLQCHLFFYLRPVSSTDQKKGDIMYMHSRAVLYFLVDGRSRTEPLMSEDHREAPTHQKNRTVPKYPLHTRPHSRTICSKHGCFDFKPRSSPFLLLIHQRRCSRCLGTLQRLLGAPPLPSGTLPRSHRQPFCTCCFGCSCS